MTANGIGGARPPPTHTQPSSTTPTAHSAPTPSTSPCGATQQQLDAAAADLTETARQISRTPQALYSSSTWAINNPPPSKSATLPAASNWPNTFTPRLSLNPSHALVSSAHVSRSSPLRSEYIASPPRGVGATNNPTSQHLQDQQPSSSMANIHYTQTESYHNSPTMPSPLSQHGGNGFRSTDPLPQGPFEWPSGTTAKSSSGSDTSHHQAVPNTPNSMALTHSTHGTTQSSAQQMSPGSSIALSEHYLTLHPEKAGMKADVWSERPHPRGLRRTLKDNEEWIEAYEGAMRTLGALNPEQFQMPYGARVINVKTDFANNILRSIRQGKIAVMAKIADRIMTVWNARQNPSEKVLFIFAVNGSGRYTGVAEMAGPWNPKGSFDGWESVHGSDPTVGTIPVVWVYAKDVAFHQFKHLRQDNGNPVGNMWNGMNFPSELGRKVMEIYVQTPATSSILGHPKYEEEANPLVPYSATTAGHLNWRRNAQPPRGGRGGHSGHAPRGGGRSNFRGSAAYQSQHWRAPSNPFSNAGSDHESTPTPTNPTKMFTLQSGQQVPAGSTFQMNERGELVLVGTGIVKQEPAPQLRSVNSYQGLRSVKEARGGADRRTDGVHGARSLTSLRPSSGSSSAMLSQTTHSTSATSPYAAGRFDQSAPSTTGLGMQYAFQSPEASLGSQYYDSYGDLLAMETPTHRPIPHGVSPAANMSVNLLQAKYHGLQAEIFGAQYEVGIAKPNDPNIRLLNTKLQRLLTEKREIEAQLAAIGLPQLEAPPQPTRHDSFTSTDEGASTSTSSYDISPVRAEDGRVLKSASKFGSPPRQADDNQFDRAPGGSSRQKKGHAYKESYGDEVKKSINELLKSPEDTPAQVHSASSFFQPSSFLDQNGISPAFTNGQQYYGTSVQSTNNGTSFQSTNNGTSFQSINNGASFQSKNSNRSPNIMNGSSGFATPTSGSFFTPLGGSFPTPGSARCPVNTNGGGSFPTPTTGTIRTPATSSFPPGSFTAQTGNNGSFTAPAPGTVQRARGGGVRLDS